MKISFQILVTKPDFYNEHSRKNLRSTVQELIRLNIVPIINANDAVAPPPDLDVDLQGVSTCKTCKHNYDFEVIYSVMS